VPFCASPSESSKFRSSSDRAHKAGTITQEMLTDPASLLRSHIAALDITATTAISISTDPSSLRQVVLRPPVRYVVQIVIGIAGPGIAAGYRSRDHVKART
jgi:hypothetical protein